ncbi:hypothetical protein CXF59_12335 [Flavobacterium sp. ALD4]|uniref:hypothetical protein n=1 Tax=Flavobacterium sp. ALD4 TaxID=2058314 RepID=UPI000C3220EC|nr:hypothetical protein [Flavobacterium sp. ALD4]PKH66706.1 hypothetical protein CXF59_12335 [Flavobacterium sp. ALD4]
MARKKETINQKIENNPFTAMTGFFCAGFGLCFLIMQFYYNDRISDIKERYVDKLEQEKKIFQNNLDNKALEIQQQERDRYYLKIEENSINGKLLEKILDYNEMKGGKYEK